MNDRRAGRATVACVGLAVLTAAAAGAQVPEPGAARCEALLTREEVVAIVGAAFEGPAVAEPRPDFTSCDWQGPDANFGFTFSGAGALKADQKTAEEAFEDDVTAVENDQRKREVLADVGLKAAQVSLGDDAFLVEVQRPDGVARMIFYKIAADKITAIARAVASP